MKIQPANHIHKIRLGKFEAKVEDDLNLGVLEKGSLPKTENHKIAARTLQLVAGRVTLMPRHYLFRGA